MIRFLIILILFLCCRSIDTTAQERATKEDSLSTSILINPNDLLHTISEWNAATTDGFTYRVNTGLYGFYGPQPTIYLDGIPADFSFFNWQNMNMLPTSMEQINRISYSSKSQIFNHSLAPAGYLNLHSAQPDSGLHIYGSFTVGNQIEDPGPWSYDSSKVTPNIDRRGPHYFSQFSYRASNWYAKGQLSLRQHQPTNLNNNHRIGSYSFVDGTWHAVKTKVKNGLGEIGYQSNGWKLRTRAMLSNNEEYVFFQPFGREVPATTEYRQLVVQGEREFDSWTFSGQYRADQKDLGYRINNKEYNFDWHQFKHIFSLSARYQNKGLDLQSGGRLEVNNTDGLQLDNQQAIATLYGRASAPLHRNHTLHSTLDVDIATHQTVPSFSVGSEHQLTDAWNLSTDLSYAELLYYRQQSSTYWVQRGYDLYSHLGIGQDESFSSKKNRSAAFNLTNRIELASTTSLTLEGKYIHHYALNIPWQVVAHEEEQYLGLYTQPQDFEFTSEPGDRLNLMLGITQNLGSLLSHELNIIGQYTTRGSSRYRDYWRQSPQTRMNYEFQVRPVSDLKFSMMATYRSSTQWKEYQNLEGERYQSLQPQYPLQLGTFHTRTPSFLNMDITAKKWFWDRRLATTFSVRNLLNTEVRYHTMGLDKATKFIIKASLTL